VVLCDGVLYCIVLCWAGLCWAVLRGVVLYCDVMLCVVWCCMVWYVVVLCGVEWCCEVWGWGVKERFLSGWLLFRRQPSNADWLQVINASTQSVQEHGGQ
jgi:hypothetical protein